MGGPVIQSHPVPSATQPEHSPAAVLARIKGMSLARRHTLKSAKAFLLALGLSTVMVSGSTRPSAAEAQAMPLSQTKAANLARMRAESINGGLSSYRADRCMYSTGAPDCLESLTPEGYVFRFQGGAPGWQGLQSTRPTVITTVTVSADGESILDIINTPLP